MSQKLELDYVDNHQFSFKEFSLKSLMFCIVGIGLSVLVFNQYQRFQAKYEKISSQLNQDQSQIIAQESLKKAQSVTISATELQKIHETISDLSTPWDVLLNALETIQMPDIALLIFEPNKKKQQVTLTGQAKNIKTMLQYVEALSALNVFSNVYLQNHVIDDSDPYKPVNFTIVAKWNEKN